jgi:hypothetical protein
MGYRLVLLIVEYNILFKVAVCIVSHLCYLWMGQMNTVIGCTGHFPHGRHINHTIAGIMNVSSFVCSMLFVWAKHLMLFTKVYVRDNEK